MANASELSSFVDLIADDLFALLPVDEKSTVQSVLLALGDDDLLHLYRSMIRDGSLSERVVSGGPQALKEAFSGFITAAQAQKKPQGMGLLAAMINAKKDP